MKLVLAQLNPVIGDLDGNAEKIFEVCKSVKGNDVDLVVTPELSLIGYPPKDLLFNPRLFEEQRNILTNLSKRIMLQLGLKDELTNWNIALKWGILKSSSILPEPIPIMEKIELIDIDC